MRLLHISFLSLLLISCLGVLRVSCGEDDDEDRPPLLPMPSKRAIEMVGVKFIDALIKKGQVEMAKGAFKTQLDVLEKVHPEQYEKYKEMSIDELATDAVMQQSAMAKLQPKTGNPFVDMLNENGIPIASSLKGLEQAIKTQRDMETQDPSEQIMKAVLEKFQTQILPGLVANMIAGRNPFKVPQQTRKAQPSPDEMRRRAMAMAANPQTNWANMNQQQQQQVNNMMMPEVMKRQQQQQQQQYQQLRYTDNSLAHRLRSSPRLRHLLENPEVAAALSPRLRDEVPMDGDDDDEAVLDNKAAIVLGIHDFFGDLDADTEKGKLETSEIRRSSLALPKSFVQTLEGNEEVKRALEGLTYRVNDYEKYLKPKPFPTNPKAQPGFFVPRKIPTRPRKMLPLLIGLDPSEAKELRRSQNTNGDPLYSSKSRTIQNLQNNPNIAPLFLDDHLETILTGRSMLTDEQKGKPLSKKLKTFPRLYGSKTLTPIDAKVSQVIEERPVPPAVWTPKGRHTRLRWTGATEKEVPGLGGRFILPSLDPTVPAVNTVYSTQGRTRDEWDSTFKIPNFWAPGDETGFSMKHNSKHFYGGTAGMDMPALGL